MGTALWIATGIGAGFLARIIPFRRGRLVLELMAAVLAAVLAGLIATALDFGGWREPDWRAGVFALLLGLAGVAAVRLAVSPSVEVPRGRRVQRKKI